jgi:hypothetical protein
MSRICGATTRSRYAWRAGVIGNRGLAAGSAVLILLGSVVLGTSAASAAVGPVAAKTDATTWMQQAELEATPYFGSFDKFGTAVDISGTTAIVGATESAGAYIFDDTGGSWAQAAMLTPPSYGGSVAISGSTAVVGALQAAFHSAAAAYVYGTEGGSWVQQADLTIPDATPQDYVSVASSGSTIAVGGWGTMGTPGVVYVFGDVGGSWVQQAEITGPAGPKSYSFGSSIHLAGSNLAIGAIGAAYVYNHQGGHWAKQVRLATADGGGAVAISGTTLVAGGDPDTYVFSDAGGSWIQVGELVNPPKATNSLFGDAVAVAGSTVMVGAEGNDHYRGSAYVFRRAKGSWRNTGKLVASDRRPCTKTDEGTFCDEFGNAIAMSGTTVILGSASWGVDTGSAYIFVPAAAAGDFSASD